MERKGKKCNTDPERARKRAKADLRCAARKLGLDVAQAVLDAMARESSGVILLDNGKLTLERAREVSNDSEN